MRIVVQWCEQELERGWFCCCHSAHTRLVISPPTRAFNNTLSKWACDTPQYCWWLQHTDSTRTRTRAAALLCTSSTRHCNMQQDHHDCFTLAQWMMRSHCFPPVEIQHSYALSYTLLCSCLHVPVQTCSRRLYAVPVSNEIGLSPDREKTELQMLGPYSIIVQLMCAIDAYTFNRGFNSW